MYKFFKYLASFFYFLAFVLLMSGVLSFFYEGVEATSMEVHKVVAYQNGYGGGRRFDGGEFIFSVFTYNYEDNVNIGHRGYGLKISMNWRNNYDNKIYFSKWFPAISVMEKVFLFFG